MCTNIDFKKIREDFPLLTNRNDIYFDNAATSQRPQIVLDKMDEFYRFHNANPLRGLYELSQEATEDYENARKNVADFINASSEREIIFTRNTSESINLVAYTYGLSFIKENDKIVTTIMEHHSNQLPWQMVSQKTGATLEYMYCEKDGTFTDETIEKTITEGTKLVCMMHVSNVLGCVNPIEKVIKRAHEVGAKVLIDCAQSICHYKVDVKELDCDFIAFSGHKMLGPFGIGVLYGKEELLDKMPPFLTGGEMIESVTVNGAKWAELPHKFEAGTVNAQGAVGLNAAIEYLKSIGIDNIRKQEETLARRAIEGLKNVGHINILGSDAPSNHTGIISFAVDGVHPHDISAILEADNIDIRAGHHCAQPLLSYLGVRSSARASLMFYNTIEEVDTFVESVSKIREKMGYGD